MNKVNHLKLQQKNKDKMFDLKFKPCKTQCQLPFN